MKHFYVLVIITLIFSCKENISHSELIGIWKFDKVKVNGFDRTDYQNWPYQKWLKINKDGTFTSGHGHIVNYRGRWKTSKSEPILSLICDEGDIWDTKWEFRISNNISFFESLQGGGGYQNVKIWGKKSKKIPVDFEEETPFSGLWQLTPQNIKNFDEDAIGWMHFYDDGSMMMGYGNRIIDHGFWEYNKYKQVISLCIGPNSSYVSDWCFQRIGKKLIMEQVDGDYLNLSFNKIENLIYLSMAKKFVR
ncbi:hypothetical protein [Flexithrix dorotheae]|uniref:hypothetical protein n=1 Tax=Flexithrix dorotheae TaxID=70993 RepID=UPI00037E048A|nr:hypothetical protein [Flexithrix dorotheae]